MQLKNENYQFSTRNWVRHEHVDSFTGSKLSLTQNQAKPSYANSFSFPGKIIKERVFRSYWITRLRTDLKPFMWSSNLDRKNLSKLFGTVVNEVLMINWISKIVWAFQKLSAFCLSYLWQSERHYLPDFSQRTVVPAFCFLHMFMVRFTLFIEFSTSCNMSILTLGISLIEPTFSSSSVNIHRISIRTAFDKFNVPASAS